MSFPISAALLDAIVLSVVAQEPEGTYGYKITQQVTHTLELSESTLYPVLRRLQKDQLLTVYDAPFNGRNRRYYQITSAGRAQLAAYAQEWSRYRSSIDTFFREVEWSMTRTAFLAALEQLLAPLPESERKDALSYYEDYLDAAGPENEARAIAELGSPEEVARKILDEQSPQGASAAPASPARKPRSRWRMVLGGGLAVLVLACFFFQHSKATPVQPVEPASPAADSSSVPEEASSSYLAVLADTVPLTIPADDLGESTLQIPLEKLNQELKLSLNYGSVTFVTDPSLTSDKYATFQFDNFPHSPVLRTTGGDGRTTLTFEMPENWQVAEDAPEAMLTVTIPADALARLIISLETGDVRLAPMQLKTLTVALNNGGLRAENLTVTRDLLVELPVGGCNIDHLSIAEYASIAATRCIRLHLDGDPADYTTDARTDNVVRIGNKEYDKRYTSSGPNGILNLYAKGLIYLNVDE